MKLDKVAQERLQFRSGNVQRAQAALQQAQAELQMDIELIRTLMGVGDDVVLEQADDGTLSWVNSGEGE